MATPLTADAIVGALTAEGCQLAQHAGWRTHNRDSVTGKTFGPVNGIVIHHTAGTNSLALVYNGRSDLPGPLCHTHLAKTGVATMVGHGRVNHAGMFAQNAVDAVVDESSTHPRPDAAEPVDGNDRFYGIEIENLGDGHDPYPAVQYQAAVRWAAAICRAHGWSADSVIGHKEGTRRKTDPSFDMATFRLFVADRLTHPASWDPNEEDDMPLTTDDVRKIWVTDGIVTNPNAATAEANPFIAPATGLRNIEIITRRTETTLAALQATNDKLVETVATLAANIGGLDPATVVAELKTAIASITIHIDTTS